MNKAVLFVAGFALTSPAFAQGSPRPADARDQVTAPYDPIINPADFTHVISNKYYTLNLRAPADCDHRFQLIATTCSD